MKKLNVILGFVLAGSMALAGCKGGDKAKQTKAATSAATQTQVQAKQATTQAKESAKKTQMSAPSQAQSKVSLEDWAGEWNDIGTYLDKEELKPAFAELAKKEKKSVEESKKEYVAKRKCDFHGLVINKDEIRFLETVPSAKGKEIAKTSYTHKKTVKTKHGNHDLTWEIFEAKGDAKYPVLALMPIHGEESLTHFHLRYGKDADTILKQGGWFPTFIKPNSTMSQIAEEVSE